jgi:hypothetical protein
MAVLLENASELANLAREVGAEVLEGHLRYPSETGGWTLSVLRRQGAEALGELDLDEYLAKFRDRKLVLLVAPISEGLTRGQDEPATVTCGICGFVMSEAGECASPLVTIRCKLEIAERARGYADTGEDRDVVDQVADWLDSEGGAA